MEEWVSLFEQHFIEYIDTFKGLSEEQRNNFAIKRDHSLRVAEIVYELAKKQKIGEQEQYLAFFIGLFHDIGRFKQLVEYNTFNDAKSVDHADCSVGILKEHSFFYGFSEEQIEVAFKAIQLHNKRELPQKMPDEERLFAQLIRDADKLDILKVLTDYYTNPKAIPNHTLTWEMPKGNSVSAGVAKQILGGNLVDKKLVSNELDVKVMQLSWVYDICFKASFEILMKNRYLEKIYNSMPKNDTVFEIYRKIKVYAENKFID